MKNGKKHCISFVIFSVLLLLALGSAEEKRNDQNPESNTSSMNHEVDGMGVSLAEIRREIILKNGFHPDEGPYQNRGESIAPPVTVRSFARGSGVSANDEILLIGDSSDIMYLKLSMRNIFRDQEKAVDSLQLVNEVTNLIGSKNARYIDLDQ
jgi:hypothetical protein